MRAALVAALCIAGCKDTPKPDATKVATPPAVDWDACTRAIHGAGMGPLPMRPKRLLDGCHVCGDWTPLLRWNTTADQGGPKRIDIERAMDACNGYCTGDAKLKFLGTLDDARGTGSRMPWKQLALLCKDRVSAIVRRGTGDVADSRYIDGTYFALDRIGRAVAAHDEHLAAELAKLELPLPAVSLSGNGPPLPVVPGPEQWPVGDLQITVLAGTVSVGRMPHARLTKNGVEVWLDESGFDSYPGKTVTPDQLAAALTELTASVGLENGPARHAVTILAAPSTPAASLVPIVAVAAPITSVSLGVRSTNAPDGWELPASLPIPLSAGADLAITADMTVQQLVDVLVKRTPGERVGIHAP